MIVGFLHTSSAHTATFRSLVAEIAPGWTDVTIVDESLLEDALGPPGEHGTDAVAARVASRIEALAARGARVVVCTCSTIGELAERCARDVPVVRVDRAMAEEAVRGEGATVRVLMVAALAATVGPTSELIHDCARSVARRAEITVLLCEAAWPLFLSGRLDEYAAGLAAHVRSADPAGTVDIVVLAQASMAPAATRLADLGIPVLSSPVAAVRRAVALSA